MSLSGYNPGSSFVHRVSPGFKIISLLILGTLLFVVPRIDLSAAALAGIVLLYLLAKISLKTAWMQLRPALWIFVLIFIVQLFLHHWTAGVLVIVRLISLLLLASLVTLTTRSSDMIDALEKGLGWLYYFGINPGKVSLALSLALRFIPVLASITEEVREAQKARGLDKSVIAIAVPVIVRMLKMADDISAAIEARSYDPEFDKSKSSSK
ncbi:energy-coupling factor transporter transmembrane protein EcfT [Photorhabdus laumondii subsp. laumondii]|uniref:Photorhabdus luminescens subsp. laumondii TTO1 complete genome segment 14/17 n=2 Tax=Photorhabdus laumondii subsp. laumondii TaxID=141679 RepID=Q7MB02_PHOLL|nr:MULTISPECIES: energy-coupling factor transporter transmembrane protein EcfT [Photorhabdus]AWK43457.1 cobalt ABC transporter permease [Photorhabdus laumondii subsp. laumondii]AXG44133.1 energy-coupling factor transporter transmembrane protein EcfT [Photorhabdus laumondii subsp. laumondii]AXG48763.1 energy-coupling factor transporter transmembrane protein EcfT [Photorhabdus laumondii subsp. laumondii]KTL63447.1 cobalt ABC transporter permease [Photorhabdus laumondii subsp. laumondii]MCC838300